MATFRLPTRIALGPAPRARRAVSSRAVLLGGALVAVAGALVAAGNADGHTDDPDLALLLRFMGFVKLAMAAGATALVAWGLGSAVGPTLRPAAVVATWCLWAGATLVSCLALMVPAAILFHAGLLTLTAVGLLEHRTGSGERP